MVKDGIRVFLAWLAMRSHRYSNTPARLYRKAGSYEARQLPLPKWDADKRGRTRIRNLYPRSSAFVRVRLSKLCEAAESHAARYHKARKLIQRVLGRAIGERGLMR